MQRCEGVAETVLPFPTSQNSPSARCRSFPPHVLAPVVTATVARRAEAWCLRISSVSHVPGAEKVERRRQTNLGSSF